MAKGYSFQGLVDSVLMKLNLLSEIKEQGEKAQKEARDNLDVYGKEQTYNKLETDNHISLVVDNAPSTLNTLNKLAQAINNNPKFAEKLHLLLDQKLAKSDNGADIPDKNLFVKNLGLTETIDCAKNALDKRTGGTVNGVVIVEGNQLVLKGDDRKHLGFHNQDGRVRMWLYKDKGGDGVHLNNGEDGGGDWVFNKNGHFYSPQALHAAGATYQEDGNIHGSLWGGHLSGYLHNTFSKKVNDYGEIGSYLMALCNTGNIGPNGTVSGENLRASTADGIVEGGPLPGMWRCMGNMNTRNNAHRTTLWVRIS